MAWGWCRSDGPRCCPSCASALLPTLHLVGRNITVNYESRRADYYRHDDSQLPVPTLSAPALLRMLSRAPSVTSLTLGDGAVDFYDDSFLTSLLAACPKLTCLTLGEPRFTAAPPPFTISLSSLDSFFRAAAPQLQQLALLLAIEAPKLPDSISSLSSLCVLRLRSIKIQQLPDGLCHLPALQELQFSCSMLWDVPEDFGQLKALTHLSIVDSMNSALSLPDSLGDLSSLTSLCIAFPCGRLPDSITALQQLRRLQLRLAGRLHLTDVFIPSPLPHLARLLSLHKLRIRRSAHLPHSEPFIPFIPENIGELAALESLELKGRVSEKEASPYTSMLSRINRAEERPPERCNHLEHLPREFGSFGALTRVTIEGSFSTLPDTLGGLSSLQEASLKSPVLASLPPSFCLLSRLHTLTITGSDCLVTLPSDFGSLSALQRLSIHSCFRVHSLPDSFSSLASLVHLAITNCPKLSTLPDGFGSLTQLARLTFIYCDSFTHLPASFPCLPSLRVASFSCCPRMHPCLWAWACCRAWRCCICGDVHRSQICRIRSNRPGRSGMSM
ncbi:unnamed protein product [Closterium sp. Naga37s-1]|nr:unnamed protein product [Closterium sp. Naga37s-1]